ncbi:MAG: acylglycerol kinase family protein, partial [Bacillota bacterium]
MDGRVPVAGGPDPEGFCARVANAGLTISLPRGEGVQPLEWYFIVNPVAGRGRTARLWPLMQRKIAGAGIPFRAALTTAPGEARELARRAAEEGAAALVGIGGDGTTGEIVNGVLSSARPDIPIGAVPTGTGNDFVRGQGLPLSWEAVLGGILEGSQPAPVDAFEVKDARGN